MASTMAIEGKHRQVYESFHGPGTFPDDCKAAEDWPDKLLDACKTLEKWKGEDGAVMDDVLDTTQDKGGVLTDGTLGERLLRLRGWEKHSGDGLTPERVAALIDQGPCIGRLWVCPWYYLFNAANNWVYRGCGRNKGDRVECKREYGNGSHVVVCCQYRRCNGQIHVLVLDNHDDDGPERWVDAEELDALFTLKVDAYCLCGLPNHSHEAGTSLAIPALIIFQFGTYICYIHI